MKNEKKLAPSASATCKWHFGTIVPFARNCLAIAPFHAAGSHGAGSRDNTLRLWDRQNNGGGGSRVVGSRARVPAVAGDPTGGTLATAGADGAVRFWNAHTGALIRSAVLDMP